MAKTDKPKKDGSGAKKSKAKDVRQPLGEKGTFASKTPNLPVNTRGKKKGNKAKPKQPQAVPPVDQFEVCENIQSDCFLPISDIDSFSDCCGEGNQAAIAPMDEDAFDTIVKSLCVSPLKNLPEQPVEIDNTSHVLPTDKEEPLCQSVPSPSRHRPLPQPLQASSAPLLQPSVAPLPTQRIPALTPPLPPAPLSSSSPSPQQMTHSAGCSARSHRLPAMDMFRLREPTAPASTSSLSSLPISSALFVPPTAPTRSWSTQRAAVHTISPSPPQMFDSIAPAPREHIPHQSRKLTQGPMAPAWQFEQFTALQKRPLPQPLLPSKRLLLQPKYVSERLKNGSRVIVTKGMHEGRRGIVRGVQRAGKKGPLQHGLWSVLLDGKDIVALSDEFLTLQR